MPMECGKKELGELSGHLIALATICVWGSTFIFSKTLLDVFTPVQIMLLRFFVAYAVLWCMYPKTEKTTARDNLGIFFMSLLRIRYISCAKTMPLGIPLRQT